jgi:peptide/nickel transport system substrate-binding protein
MKKLLVSLTILLVLAFIITGCGTSTPTPTTPAATQSTTAAPPATTLATSTAATGAATKPPVTPAANKTGGILRFVSTASPGTPIGWMQETAGASTVTMQLCLDTLLHEQLDGTLVPNLASSYDLNTDPNSPSLVFHLRQGIKFSDGSDFNAEAVKWDLETTGKGPPNAGQAAYWKSFEVLDDYTLRVNFTSWQNRLLRSFADASTYLYSPTAYEQNGLDWIRWHMVGPGPFKQVDFQRDVVTKTVRNEYYWEQGKPYLDGVNLLYVLDEMTRLALFKSGGADVMDLAGNARIASDLKASGYQIISKQGGVTVLVPDSSNADSPWSNPMVRQAAEYAIDKDAIAKTFGYGYWQAAYQLPSPSTTAYDPNFAGRKYDAAKAKQLLVDAGYPGGFKTKIIAQTGATNPDIPLAIQAYLAKVGIQADLEYQDAAKYTGTIQGTWNNGLVLNTFLEWPNYNNGFNFYFGPTSPFFKSLQKPDGWSDAFKATLTSPAPDVTLMRKCVNLLYDNSSVVALYYGASIYAATQNVRDTGLDTRSSIYWNKQDTWLSK